MKPKPLAFPIRTPQLRFEIRPYWSGEGNRWTVKDTAPTPGSLTSEDVFAPLSIVWKSFTNTEEIRESMRHGIYLAESRFHDLCKLRNRRSRERFHRASVARQLARDAELDRLHGAARAEVERLKAAGWTKADFAKALKTELETP